MTLRRTHRASNRRALLIFLAALVGVIAATAFAVGALQASFLRDEAHIQLHTELSLLGELAIEPVLRYDYAAVERLVKAWVERRTDPLEISVRMPNGFELTRARNRDGGTRSVVIELPVLFDDKPLLTLQADADFSEREAAVSGIARDAAFIAMVLIALLGWGLWMLLQRTAIRPLETEIDARERREEELRHRTAELEGVVRELETFSYSVSHDLRGPLRAIDGFGMALAEDYGDVLDPTAKDYLARMRAAAQRMGLLIDDLLALARTSHHELQLARTDLTAMAEDWKARTVQGDPLRPVKVHIAKGLSAQTDAALMRIALDNLLGNAWKYTERNPEARIELGAREQDGETVYFVRDNGAGFDMRFADKLFQPFQRLHNTEYAGTGIGLAIVRRIIERHGGRIWAEAQPGQGATFYFTLGARSKLTHTGSPA